MKKNITRRVVAAAGIAGAAAMGLTSLSAGGATAGPLPGGKITKTLVDGTPVTVQLFDEYVNVQRAISNVPTSREAWLSGKVRVTVGGKAEGGVVKVGFDVGCQVNFGAGAGAEGGYAYSPPSSGNSGTYTDPSGGTGTWQTPPSQGGWSPSGGANGSVSLGPGQVERVWLVNTTSGTDTAYSDYKVNTYTFKGSKGGVVYSQEKLGVNSCAGHASAKAVVQVTVSTDSVKGVVVLNGKPFSLG
ncbi:MspA family porin [Gordonia aurantiaca]|uniref:MspA family porin n=1 Tax=Gordonia sp. B21 TaxID=3151852 RepID=UPI0032677A7B